jgi:serine/threonine protein kinase
MPSCANGRTQNHNNLIIDSIVKAMKRDFRMCFACNQINSLEDVRCQGCNTRLDSPGDSKHFLNETFPRARDTLLFIEGSIINDRYRIEKLIGKGPSSKVYLATDITESKMVALKVTMLSSNDSEIHAPLSLPVARLKEMINDFSNIIQIFDHTIVPWEGIRLSLLSMEIADGGSFRDWLTTHTHDPEKRIHEGIDFFKQACHGASSLHQAGIIHLDLKPENLLLINGSMKVSDFDMSSIILPGVSENMRATNALAHNKESPAYMSPERFFDTGKDIADTRMDIYALGIILFEIVHPSGQTPFRGSFQRLKADHIEASVPTVSGIGKQLDSIVKRCLQKNPNDRYQSVQELIADLVDVRGDRSSSSHDPDDATAKADQQRDRLWNHAYSNYTRGDFHQASAFLDELLDLTPQHAQARTLRNELDDRYSKAQLIYDEIGNNPENDLDESIAMLKEAVDIYPNHPSGEIVQTKLAVAADNYREAMEKGFDAFQRSQWKVSLQWFRTASLIHRAKPDLATLIDQLSRIVDAKDRIELALEQPDFATAMHLAQWVDIQVEELKQEISAFQE